MIEILISICIILGVFLSLIGSIGILRLKDAYGRMHAATKSATLGIIFVIIGTFFMFLMRGELLLQLLFAIVFVFLTAPVAAMIILGPLTALVSNFGRTPRLMNFMTAILNT
ncbi:Na(+) H(+) antiporter subunit G [Geomicrobium sp. JCM 19037]|uniref:monovalent cation/H(+) antiporter subunit G n=1 Tax=Geomicrobium sp. JCM 19037 TaxID=1460634 RepID=UPI00045F1799|nr:monovalent cation/H(+) antiporter subunit G [Geomicrobium sp. JCM 19037]GAK04134.1 Na(+) H(+) antiporter subunit G [Geomicrobium sp. JCM 19037]